MPSQARGTAPGADPQGVLEDPSGRRARWLRVGGRAVFTLFLLWLLAIVLGGLGVGPTAKIPLLHALRPSPGPPVARLPPPAQPARTDLRPAVPAPTAAAGNRAGPSAGHRTHPPRPHAKSSSAPGHTSMLPPGQAKRATTVTVSLPPGQAKRTTTVVVPPGRAKRTTTVVVPPAQAKRTTTTTTTPHGRGGR